MVDAATLTGAVVIALGHHAVGLMGNDDRLLDEVRHAGEGGRALLAAAAVGRVPRADQSRTSRTSRTPAAGRRASITAGWFLREFVDGFPWAHLDIAGTAYPDADRPDIVRGPAGTGVRLFTELVLGRAGG